MSEIRYDRLNDRHVIIAPERLHRPDCTSQPPSPHRHVGKCPFCEGNESMTPPEIFAVREADSYANEPGWKCRVVPNLYKAVQIETPYRHHDGPFAYDEGFGAHEVIIDMPVHRTCLAQWETEEAVIWLKTLGARVADLKGDTRIAYISLFKNEGKDAGATQPHSHTQLIGLPVIPETKAAYFDRCLRHYHEHHSALLEVIIDQERHARERIIDEREDFVAYCPFASAYPFEVAIACTTAGKQIDTLEDKDRSAAAGLLLDVMVRLDAQLGCCAYNIEIVTPPLSEIDRAFRFMIRILPRIYRYGGFELSTQMMINPVTPEEAARLLRGEKHG